MGLGAVPGGVDARAGCCCGGPAGCPRRARSRPPVAVVVPARDEAAALPRLLGPLLAQLRPGDELVVVDDHSTDATAVAAGSFGATVVAAPDLPAGWVGKPHACWAGARPRRRRLLRVPRRRRPSRRAAARRRGGRRSPPHPGRSSRCSRGTTPTAGRAGRPPRQRRRPDGQRRVHGARPPAAGRTSRSARCSRWRGTTYDRTGGHAHPDVRGQPHRGHRPGPCASAAASCTRSRDDASFRMYPAGSATCWPGGRGRSPPGSAPPGGGWPSAWRRGCGRSPAVRSSAGWRTRSARCRSGCSVAAPGGSDRSLAAAYPLAVLVLVVVVAGAVVNRVRGRDDVAGPTRAGDLAHVEEELADVGVGLHVAVGVGDVVEREAAVDHRAQRPVREQRQHLVGEAPADRHLLLDGP